MRQKFIYIAICAVTLFSTVSCSNLLDVDLGQSVTRENALNSKDKIEASTMGVYARLRNVNWYGSRLITYPEIMSNTAAHSGTSTNFLNHARNVRLNHMQPWAIGYNAIVQINATLEALEDFEAEEQWKKRIAGQLHFLRALFYHTLAKVYAYDPTATGTTNRGSVPLIVDAYEDYREVRGIERASHEEMYEFLYNELETAYEYLLETTPNSEAPRFATAGAAAALLSRVALHNGDWPKVVEAADRAIASGIGRMSTPESYKADWRSVFHPESLFELEFTPADNMGANNALRVVFTNRLSETSDVPNGNGYVMVSPQLYSEYAAEDVRRQLIMYGVDRESDKLHMTKFFNRSGQPNLDNVPVIRLSEMYLNRAEAYANISEMELEALADVNFIRTHRGLEPLDPDDGYFDEVLLEVVWQERRLELAFEGHSWFDFKRTRRNIEKPHGETFLWTDPRLLARFPLREVRMHSGLLNNRNH